MSAGSGWFYALVTNCSFGAGVVNNVCWNYVMTIGSAHVSKVHVWVKFGECDDTACQCNERRQCLRLCVDLDSLKSALHI